MQDYTSLTPIKAAPFTLSVQDNNEESSPLKKLLFWPKNEKQIEKPRNKDKVTSVITSEWWQMYFNKKEEQKATKEQNKEFRKRAREERKAGKELKEKVGKRTCKTNVNLQNDERVDWNCCKCHVFWKI